MGFSSYLCAKSKISIPAYQAAGCLGECSKVVVILPNDDRLVGFYDGYGKLAFLHGGVKAYYDIYEQITDKGWDESKPIWEQVKMVRSDKYAGEVWKDLKFSKSCKDQGYFYSEAKKKKINKSLFHSVLDMVDKKVKSKVG